MEAAACYIGECKNPSRDAKIALNLEGGYGLFIYTLIPVAFVIVIGNHALGNAALVDPKTIFVTFSSKVFGAGAASTALNWIIGLMLIVALVLSALNAITGTARSLHQMSTDGNFPKIFSKLNKHGVPSSGMFFTVICSIAVVFMGGAVEIYTFSNVGYLIVVIAVLLAYAWLRHTRPNLPRPIKLPGFMKYVALLMAAFFLVIYFYGGPIYASCSCSQAGHSTLLYYFLGLRGAGAVPAAVPVAAPGRGQAGRGGQQRGRRHTGRDGRRGGCAMSALGGTAGGASGRAHSAGCAGGSRASASRGASCRRPAPRRCCWRARAASSRPRASRSRPSSPATRTAPSRCCRSPGSTASRSGCPTRA